MGSTLTSQLLYNVRDLRLIGLKMRWAALHAWVSGHSFLLWNEKWV